MLPQSKSGFVAITADDGYEAKKQLDSTGIWDEEQPTEEKNENQEWDKRCFEANRNNDCIILGRSKLKNFSKASIFWITFKGRRSIPLNGLSRRPF